MNTEGVKIRYGDVAPEAKENFNPEATDKTSFSDLSQLQEYNLKFPNFANPCEYGAVLLDSSSEAFPLDTSAENIGLWSESVTGSDGAFTNPVTLTLTSEGQYSSQGITLTFDTYNSIFCNDLTITWYRNNSQIAAADFTPNSAFYFCWNKVENFNKLTITFKKLNMPHNRLKLRAIDYGYGTFFDSKELRNVGAIQELNPISTEISINTVDFTLDSKSDMEYSFQSKQPLEVYFNGELRAVTFVSKSQRQSKTIWKVESEDYIGQLSKLTFMGGMYSDKNAKDLLTDIFTQAKIPFSISSDLEQKTVSGHISICDCREAVRQICFAIGAVCSTADSDKVNIYTISSAIKDTVPLSRIRQGQSFDEEDRVTAVSISAHNYKQISESVDAYKAIDSGTGDNIMVTFSEPLHDLAISGGQILKSSANYAVIKANSGCVLTGKKYEDITTVYTKVNPVVSASDLENIIEITDAMLVNNSNAEIILSKVYDYLIKRNTTKLTINEGYSYTDSGDVVFDSVVKPGDIITAETEYLGTVTGRITSERFNLNGRILVKECEMI